MILARPFEGSVLVLPALIGLGLADRTARVWLPIIIIGILGISCLAYDNYRVTGHPLRLPYREYYERYEIVPPFSIVPISKTPRTSRYFDLESRNRETYERARSWRLLLTVHWIGSRCFVGILATSSGCCRSLYSCRGYGVPSGRGLL